METAASSEKWLTVPCRAVPLANGGWANDGATIHTYSSYEDAATAMSQYPKGAGWLVTKRTADGHKERFGVVVSQGDGTVAVVDSCDMHPFYPASNCPDQH